MLVMLSGHKLERRIEAEAAISPRLEERTLLGRAIADAVSPALQIIFITHSDRPLASRSDVVARGTTLSAGCRAHNGW
jgi:hypothetical protein